MNALLNCLVSPAIPSTGLDSIEFYRWSGLESMLDAGILTTLLERSPNLDTLQLHFLKELDSSVIDGMIDFMEQAINTSSTVEHLNMSGNNLDETQTETVLSTVQVSASVYSLLSMDMTFANFDSDYACRLLADFINATPSLQQLFISNQIGQRTIYVTLVQSSAEGTEDGSITVSDLSTQEVIYTRTTTRSSYVQIFQSVPTLKVSRRR